MRLRVKISVTRLGKSTLGYGKKAAAGQLMVVSTCTVLDDGFTVGRRGGEFLL